MSNEENLEHLRALFAQSLEQPESEREAWLQRHCEQAPEVLVRLRSLLAHDCGVLRERLRRQADVLADDIVDSRVRPDPPDEQERRQYDGK